MAIYEPIYPYDAWPEQFTFSPAVRVGNLVFLSGTTATDDQGYILGPGDIVLQTRHILQKFAQILQRVGGRLANIIETTEFILSLDDYEKTAQVRRELLKGPRPALWSVDSSAGMRSSRSRGSPPSNRAVLQWRLARSRISQGRPCLCNVFRWLR